jgi:putative DNA primase/helicase
VILTNEMPRLSDASGAIVSRMILLQMKESFYGQEDHKLTEKLLLERQGVLLWAIEGWKRLQGRGFFVQPDVGLEALNEMADIASPVAAFVRECCQVGPGKTIAVQDLFESWKNWCVTQGREKYHGSVQMFGRDLMAAFPSVRRRQPRMGGHQVRVYEGIGRPGEEF